MVPWVNLRRRIMARLWADAESAYRAEILDALPQPRSSARLLDVGCDDGAWTEAVRRTLGVSPAHVHGLEVVPSRAELARARGFDVREGNLDRTWPFDDESFDVVHANQVIEHVSRLDHFVEETKRVLRPDGQAIVCTENLSSWHNVLALGLGYQPFSLTNISSRRPVGNPLALHGGESGRPESWQHVHVLSLTGLRDLFEAHGFAVEHSWGSGYHPFSGRVAARLAAADPRHAHFIGIVATERRCDTLLTVAAAFYVLLPFDVIPDFIPFVGHLDDAIIVALVVQSIRHRWVARLRRIFQILSPMRRPA
jgi:SAM-dependent methyltransferase